MCSATVDRILQSAGLSLRERGVFDTSVDAIRRSAGVSTGSMYHHFPGGLRSITDQVYRLHFDDYQHSALSALVGTTTPREAVRGVVMHLLAWIETDAARAEVMFQLESLTDPSVLADAARPFSHAMERWFDQHAPDSARGQRAEMLSRWGGPAKEYGRMWIRDRTLPAPTDVATRLADDAWQALRPFLHQRGGGGGT